jgi:hypothetical protein
MKKTDIALLILLALAAGFIAGNEYQKRKKRIINVPNPSNTDLSRDYREGGINGTKKRIVF